VTTLNPVSVTAVKDGDDVVRFILTGQPLVKRFGCSHLLAPDEKMVERVRAAVNEFGAKTTVRQARLRKARSIRASGANARPSDAIQATRKVAQDWRAKYIDASRERDELAKDVDLLQAGNEALQAEVDALRQQLEQAQGQTDPQTPDQIRALLHQHGLTPKQTRTVYKHLVCKAEEWAAMQASIKNPYQVADLCSSQAEFEQMVAGCEEEERNNAPGGLYDQMLEAELEAAILGQ
jgi:hypothetical protein